MRKLSIDEVKLRIKKIHGDNIVLDESTYVNLKTKSRFIDKDYGEWWTTPDSILHGSGHKTRGNIRSGQKRSLSVMELKERLYEIHGDTVNINEDTYISSSVKAEFNDCEFGRWHVRPEDLLRGHHHPERAEKLRKKTNLERYGAECVLQNKEIREKIKKIFLDKYGGHPMKDPGVIQNHQETCLRKYGVDHPLKVPQIREKIKNVFLDKYGKTCSLQNERIVEKTRQTNLKKYGVEYSTRSDIVKAKIKKSFLDKYGVDHPSKDPNISMRIAKSQNNSYILYHWKTGEELVCQASYEKAAVEYFNKNKIDFLWQKAVFHLPNGKSYRPDCYLFDENIWIEIKGYFRNDAKLKWDWFHKRFVNSKLWDKTKLIEMGVL